MLKLPVLEVLKVQACLQLACCTRYCSAQLELQQQQAAQDLHSYGMSLRYCCSTALRRCSQSSELNSCRPHLQALPVPEDGLQTSQQRKASSLCLVHQHLQVRAIVLHGLQPPVRRLGHPCKPWQAEQAPTHVQHLSVLCGKVRCKLSSSVPCADCERKEGLPSPALRCQPQPLNEPLQCPQASAELVSSARPAQLRITCRGLELLLYWERRPASSGSCRTLVPAPSLC